MKKNVIFLLMSVFLACEKENGDCYKLGTHVTKEECEKNEKCTFKNANILPAYITSDGKCLQSANANLWWEYQRNVGVPICVERYLGDIDLEPSHYMYCKRFTESAYYMIVRNSYDPVPPEDEGWFYCDDGSISWCSSTCGNGSVEEWEQCDGDLLGVIYSSCQGFSQRFEWGGFTSGNIFCDSHCRWDFSECVTGQK